MISLQHTHGFSSASNPLRDSFLRWQCRVRQIAMRDNAGQPDDAIMPALTRDGDDEPLGHIITVLTKSPGYSLTSELMHMARKTNDPAQRREQALTFLSSSYYQKPHEFSEVLTATFPSDSAGARQIMAVGHCLLSFEAYAQRYDLRCRIRHLAPGDPLREATWWHNFLFNPGLEAETIVLGFEPVWSESRADPSP